MGAPLFSRLRLTILICAGLAGMMNPVYAGFIIPANCNDAKDPPKCKDTTVSNRLAQLEKQLNSASLKLNDINSITQEISDMNNSTGAIADESCRSACLSNRFRNYHGKILETTKANELLKSCVKGSNSLNKKVDGIISKIAKVNSLQTCGAEHQKAVDELDLYSKLLKRQQKMITDPSDLPPIDVSRMSTNDLAGRFYNTRPVQDGLSAQAVHKNNPMQTKMVNDQHYEDDRSLAISLKRQAGEGADDFDHYVDDRYGFSHVEKPTVEARAKKLHEELMDGNRVSCLRNYLYYTQRFSFAPAGKQTAYAAQTVAELFGDQYGNEKDVTDTRHKHTATQLAEIGNQELASFKTDYKGHEKWSEDGVLTALDGVLKTAAVAGSHQDAAYQTLRSVKSQGDYDEKDKRMKEDNAQADKAFGLALKQSSSSEVGFLFDTKAIKDNLVYLSKLGDDPASKEKKKQLIRDALKERINDAETYAAWIKKDQSTAQKGAKDLSKTAESMLYSSPSVIQSVIADDPQLMGSMCTPLKEASAHQAGAGTKEEKDREQIIEAASSYGGGFMMVAGGPIGIVGGAAFGLAVTGYEAVNHYMNAAVLEDQSSRAGHGENTYDNFKNKKGFEEHNQDAKTLTAASQRETDAQHAVVSNYIATTAATVGGGLVVKEVAAEYKVAKAARSTETESNAITKENLQYNDDGKTLKGVTDENRAEHTEVVLDRKISSSEKGAVQKAHEVGKGMAGEDGTLAGVNNYTKAQKVRKGYILRKVGFTREEAEQILDKGIAGEAHFKDEFLSTDYAAANKVNDASTLAGKDYFSKTSPLEKQIEGYQNIKKEIARLDVLSEEVEKSKPPGVSDTEYFKLRKNIKAKKEGLENVIASRDADMARTDTDYTDLKKHLEKAAKETAPAPKTADATGVKSNAGPQPFENMPKKIDELTYDKPGIQTEIRKQQEMVNSDYKSMKVTDSPVTMDNGLAKVKKSLQEITSSESKLEKQIEEYNALEAHGSLDPNQKVTLAKNNADRIAELKEVRLTKQNLATTEKSLNQVSNQWKADYVKNPSHYVEGLTTDQGGRLIKAVDVARDSKLDAATIKKLLGAIEQNLPKYTMNSTDKESLANSLGKFIDQSGVSKNDFPQVSKFVKDNN